ncbi:Ig-like domain-containing protein [Pseudomonas sp. BJa5]|uniref:Ig-like domain-containing protein n=1 Tax=Pseudomonas sp. BJa5 TaxID=2936270 RepID=UPI002559A129|nr:Ig-like domain-containing protein [Pseudomonas sp. BGr12]MDL2424292.1 Ig-like domain-containing protein [Pseudomonas sp. BGr12]
MHIPPSPLGLFRRTGIASALLVVLGASTTSAAPIDDTSQPPPTDPSAYTPAPTDPLAIQAALDALKSLPEGNHGSLALPNGAYGDRTTPRTENVLQPAQQTSFNYPTNGLASPLFGAQPFTQQMLLYEEFGMEKLDPTVEAGTIPFPVPTLGAAPEQDPNNVARSGPASAALDAFLRQPGLSPFPTQYSNVLDRNPWKAQIEAFLNRHPVGSPAEGRPPGKGWSHQRWNEFYPQAAVKTAQAGARVNQGLRDSKQMHGYSKGEFGPGGLYHNTAGLTATQGTTKGIGIRLHPNMPIQNHNSVWTFDGTLPPKLMMARYGQPVLLRHYNALPIDPAANGGFGLHTLSTHEHNGHNPAESDGYTNAFFFPGQYYDYRWPLQLAGYDSINTAAQDPRAAFPCNPGETLWVNDRTPGLKTCENGSIKVRGDWRETMSTHWFHDHMLDFTAHNVYKGNAAMMNYYSALDRGNEALEDGVNLRLPSGSALPWGNRDYDVNLTFADKAWDQSGQLWFNPFNIDGFLGDQMTVNWLYKPYFDVRARSYRLRILNGSVSRYFKIAVVREIAGNGGEFPGPKGSGVSYARVPFHMVANDGNIMEHAIPFDGSMDLNGNGDTRDDNGILPTMSIAERYDIIINFGKNGIKAGDKIFFVNLMEHDTGKGPSKDAIALADVLSEKYKAVVDQTSKGPRWRDGDPVVGKFLQFNVKAYTGQDLAMDPAAYEPAKPGKAAGKSMIPLTLDRNDPTMQAKLKQARQRSFEFGRSDGTDTQPWTIKTDGGFGYAMDPRRITAAPQLASGPTDAGYNGEGTLEVWKIKNGGNGWSHPVHVHFEEGIILNRDGKAPPEWEKWSRKDLYRVGPEVDSSEEVEMAIRFREFAGTFMEHCHNTQHEDNSMLLRFDLENPGQLELMPSPMPTWDGVGYISSAALPGARQDNGEDPGNGEDDNKLPVANDDSGATKAGVPVTLSVLANDSDPDGDLPLSVVSLGQPDSGHGSVSSDGTRVTFTPPATVSEAYTAVFEYKVKDARGAVSESAANVRIAVTPALVEVDYNLKASVATVTVRSNNRYAWELAGTSSLKAGATLTITAATTSGPLTLGTATVMTGGNWRLSASTTGSGPAANPTVTIKPADGKPLTVALTVR